MNTDFSIIEPTEMSPRKDSICVIFDFQWTHNYLIFACVTCHNRFCLSRL
jgi:hypothetical protein